MVDTSTSYPIEGEAAMTTTASPSFGALTIDAADPAALADFWGKALGLPVIPGAVAGDHAIDVAGLRMILHNPVGTGTPKNSIQPVLVTDQYDEEIARLTALGARSLGELIVPAEALPAGVTAVRQTTFADPEGNEFALVIWQFA
jgi:hypothetical protein